MKSARRHIVLLNETEVAHMVGEEIDGFSGDGFFVCTSANNTSAAEDKEDGFWRFHPVNETREDFGFVQTAF